MYVQSGLHDPASNEFLLNQKFRLLNPTAESTPPEAIGLRESSREVTKLSNGQSEGNKGTA